MESITVILFEQMVIIRNGLCLVVGPPTNINISVGETSVNLSWTSRERHRSVIFHVRYFNKNRKCVCVRERNRDNQLYTNEVVV